MAEKNRDHNLKETLHLADLVKKEVEGKKEVYITVKEGQIDFYRTVGNAYVGSLFKIGDGLHVTVNDTIFEGMMGRIRARVLEAGEQQRMSLMQSLPEYTARRELQHTPM
ncbi:hypothetical protein KY349_05945 [Candidatus Woesearchaeota archaeon]|nr:hypothetical protein [Candidatus Woesearchaeota archaeon]